MKFVFEKAFITEQTAENRSGALLEFSDKFINKFNVLAISFCSSGLKQCGKFQNHTVVKDELLEMGKDLKIKHSVY